MLTLMLVEIGSISATFYCPCCRAVKSGEFRCWSTGWLKWLGCCWVFMVVLLRRQKQQWVAIPHRLYKPTGLMSTATAQRHQQQHQQPSTRPFFPCCNCQMDWLVLFINRPPAPVVWPRRSRPVRHVVAHVVAPFSTWTLHWKILK